MKFKIQLVRKKLKNRYLEGFIYVEKINQYYKFEMSSKGCSLYLHAPIKQNKFNECLTIIFDIGKQLRVYTTQDAMRYDRDICHVTFIKENDHMQIDVIRNDTSEIICNIEFEVWFANVVQDVLAGIELSMSTIEL